MRLPEGKSLLSGCRNGKASLRKHQGAVVFGSS